MKNLKNTLKPLMLLLLIGFAFTSCSSDDGPLTEEPPQGNNPTVLLECNSFQTNNADAILVLENINNDVDYIIDCVMSVSIDLKIEPGVVIEFSDAAGMKVTESGSINAIGSQSNPISFSGRSKAKGAWKGIMVSSESLSNRFDYVTMEYAGDGGLTSNSEPASLILTRDTYFRLNNVTIKNSSNNGIAATAFDYDVEINNTIINNCNIPLYADTNIVSDISGGDFTGNTIDVIRLSAGQDGSITTTQTWKTLSVPYRTADDIVIKNGAQLTLEPGVILEFEDSKGLELDKLFNEGSALIAVGTPTNPITFTGVTKAPGAWKTLSIQRSSSVLNKFDNVLIEYAGGAGAGGAIEMWVDPVLTVTNTTFKDIGACALYNRYDPTNPNLTENNNTLENVSGDYMCSN
ncbi:hypothetical protein ITJ86_04425 [Winogradskyella sp. F6397]|uniref:Right-handed parallel beta-helix repeat-containing protein n=1 Tax=Winogradskyella marina TaxID=2785530 RepID=A0ABS0EFA4_9FLAO|nr:hypothetical protein [Winogradskyella marina]MBF8149128.1 hypothetical protein [Winogradskyella marina]